MNHLVPLYTGLQYAEEFVNPFQSFQVLPSFSSSGGRARCEKPCMSLSSWYPTSARGVAARCKNSNRVFLHPPTPVTPSPFGFRRSPHLPRSKTTPGVSRRHKKCQQHFGYKRSSDVARPAREMPEPVQQEQKQRVEMVARGRRRLVAVDDVPDEVDWVEEGAVTPVQNQVCFWVSCFSFCSNCTQSITSLKSQNVSDLRPNVV